MLTIKLERLPHTSSGAGPKVSIEGKNLCGAGLNKEYTSYSRLMKQTKYYVKFRENFC